MYTHVPCSTRHGDSCSQAHAHLHVVYTCISTIEIASHIRYSFFGEKKLDAAFMKALTSSKLK